MIEFNILIVVIGLFLLFVSYLDLRFRAVPSVLLTAGIFAVFLLRPENMYYGIGAFIFAILIRDLIDDFAGLEFGKADIKVMIIMGLMASTLVGFFSMIGIFLIFQFVYTTIWRLKVSKDKDDYIPFLPCLTAVYIASVLVGVLA